MIVVIGAGISGLTAAYRLKQAGKEVLLLEATQHPGGTIQSMQQDGFTAELGPNTVLLNNVAIRDLIRDLDLEDQLIHPDETASKNRFVLLNGKVTALPKGPLSLFSSKLLSTKGLFRLLSEPWVKKRTENSEESLADLAKRRMGKEAYENFLVPFVTGIYAGDPEKMSSDHVLPMLKEAEENHGSIFKGMMKAMKARKAKRIENGLPKQAIFTFPNGLGTLPRRLADAIGDSFIPNARVAQIKSNNGRYQLTYEKDGQNIQIDAEKVIATVPAYSLANLLQPIDTTLSHLLNKVHYVPAVVLHLVVQREAIGFKTPGFGVLSRKAETAPFLGILFNSRFFPHSSPAGYELLTVISGGSKFPELVDKTDEEIKNLIVPAVAKTLAIDGETTCFHLQRWGKGIPQYNMGYGEVLEAVHAFENSNPNFYIGGNFSGGISVSDCVENGQRLAHNIMEE